MSFITSVMCNEYHPHHLGIVNTKTLLSALHTANFGLYIKLVFLPVIKVGFKLYGERQDIAKSMLQVMYIVI